jgi:hypothetical protein
VLWLVAVLLVAAYLLLGVANGAVFADKWGSALLTTSFVTMGALVVARRPDNAVGWLLCAVGFFEGLYNLGFEYASYTLRTRPDALPGGGVLAWVAAWAWAPSVNLIPLVVLLFPGGRLPSPRWRLVAALATVGLGLQMVGLTVFTWSLRGVRLLTTGTDPPPMLWPGRVLFWLGFACAVLSAPAALASVVVRFRRARGIERQQLKWFAYAAALIGAALFIPWSWLGFSPLMFVAPLLPVAVAVAILRYRLYDIDRIINRTLVYGLLTALLGGVYAGTVLVLGQVFGGVGGDPPSWVVAGATLAVAALFQPARRRVQAAVDRRFNRHKYDAAQTIEAFSARLREEVDLDTLSVELLATVDQAMEPTRASLWLRPSAEPLAQRRG